MHHRTPRRNQANHAVHAEKDAHVTNVVCPPKHVIAHIARVVKDNHPIAANSVNYTSYA